MNGKTTPIAGALLVVATASLTLFLSGLFSGGGSPANAQAEKKSVEFYGGGGPISGGVIVDGGQRMLFTSGTVPDIADKTAKPGDRARYGDTRTQAISILTKFKETLKEKGLRLNDVIYLRAYLVPDPMKGNKMDFAGWSEAYGQFFNNAENPTKVARSTVAVAGLYDSDLLIEIEAVAVYPK